VGSGLAVRGGKNGQLYRGGKKELWARCPLKKKKGHSVGYMGGWGKEEETWKRGLPVRTEVQKTKTDQGLIKTLKKKGAVKKGN